MGFAYYLTQLIRLPLNLKKMKTLLAILVCTIAFTSCARSVSPGEAANHHYKKCRSVK
jgi:hypothetical protein